MLPYSREEARDWTRAHLQGVNNVVIPSYSSDLRSLNEEGIRHDVRLQVDYGFNGFLLVSETSITPDEYIEFAEIAADESAGRQLLIHHASFNTLEENVEMAARAAEAGAALTLLSYPPSLYATSEDDIEGYTRAFCEQVDMAVMLFPVPLWGFEHVHPASLSADLMERLIDDLPTVAAIKAEGGHPSLGGFVESWNRLSDQVVVTMPLEHQAIPLAMLVPMQAIATSNTEYTGRTIPQIFDMVRDGKHDEAWRLYWQMDPARRANAGIGAIGGANSVHRLAWKYQAWLSGYNGGPLRMPTSRIVSSQMKMLRNGLVASGLPVTDDPDEAFFVGRNPI